MISMLYDLTIFINCVGYRLEWFFMFTFLLSYFLQDGMLKYKGTYEIISPDDIGLTRANEFGIVLGKLRYYATFYYDVIFSNNSAMMSLNWISLTNFLLFTFA